MKIPATPEEAKKLEEKLAANDAAEDWVTPIFPTAGISISDQALVGGLLKEIGDIRLPHKPK